MLASTLVERLATALAPLPLRLHARPFSHRTRQDGAMIHIRMLHCYKGVFYAKIVHWNDFLELRRAYLLQSTGFAATCW
jgi:hypothetical protein